MLCAFCLGILPKRLIDLGTWCHNVDFEAFSQKNLIWAYSCQKIDFLRHLCQNELF